MNKFKRKLSLVVIFFWLCCCSTFLISCGPVQSLIIEGMNEDERLHLLMTKTDTELCMAFNNFFVESKTETQIEKILRSRKIEKCDARSTIRLVPPEATTFSFIPPKVKENNSNVSCKTDADCSDGRFCWSIVGGGHECQVKTVTHEKPVIQTYDSNFVNPLNLKSLPDTVSFEHTQRINNLEKLSSQLNIQRPTIEQIQIKTLSANFPIPVIRFHFDERTFFDSGSSTVRPDSNKIIDMLAEQMKQDMPDTSLVILGHTDSVGSDEYNNDLSINRSASVMQQLAQRGVNLKQMSTIGIGETQPVATNATEDGRSQNRRVEFVLSRFEEANYVAIEQFPRNTEWLNNHPQTQLVEEPTIQEKLPVKTKQVVHVQPKATPVVHHNTEAKKLVVFKPTKEMLAPSNPEKIALPEPITMLKESTRTVTIIPAEIVHIIPSTQN
jgi:outer membrane protein OmpA-like peptidoglycan-associated protein